MYLKNIALSILAALLIHDVAAAQAPQPIPTQPLFGATFIDLNGNGQKDYGEPTVAAVIVEARHVNSEITKVWSATSEPTGDYRLLLWDPGNYILHAYCTATDGNGLSSVRVCWRSAAPVGIDGAGKGLDIPLPPTRLFLPIARTR